MRWGAILLARSRDVPPSRSRVAVCLGVLPRVVPLRAAFVSGVPENTDDDEAFLCVECESCGESADVSEGETARCPGCGALVDDEGTVVGGTD